MSRFSFLAILLIFFLFACSDEEWILPFDYFENAEVVTIPELYDSQNFENLECSEELPDEGQTYTVEGTFYLNGPEAYPEQWEFFFLRDISKDGYYIELWVDYTEIKDEISTELAAKINENPLLPRTIIVEGKIYNKNFIPGSGPGECGKMIGIHARKIGISE